MSSIASVMPTPASDLAWPSRKAAAAVSSRASRASTNASVAGVYQSPGRNHTEWMLLACHCCSRPDAPTMPVGCSLPVMHLERRQCLAYDADATVFGTCCPLHGEDVTYATCARPCGMPP